MVRLAHHHHRTPFISTTDYYAKPLAETPESTLLMRAPAELEPELGLCASTITSTSASYET